MKVRFSLWWILFFLLSLYTHQIRTYLVIFLMLFIHEMGHILCAYHFGYGVSSVMIYPFGCGAVIENIDHGSIIEEMIIVACGLGMHLLYPFIFLFALSLDLISPVFYEYLIQVNKAILLFNILPIFPLDGGRLLDCFFQRFFHYSKARLCTMVMSFIVLALVAYMRLMSGYTGLMVIVFLTFSLIIFIKEAHYDHLSFFWYRYTHPLSKPYKVQTHQDLYRHATSIFLLNGNIIDEHEWLSRKFRD